MEGLNSFSSPFYKTVFLKSFFFQASTCFSIQLRVFKASFSAKNTEQSEFPAYLTCIIHHKIYLAQHSSCQNIVKTQKNQPWIAVRSWFFHAFLCIFNYFYLVIFNIRLPHDDILDNNRTVLNRIALLDNNAALSVLDKDHTVSEAFCTNQTLYIVFL